MGQEATPESEGAAAAAAPAEEPATQVKPGLKLYDLTQFLPEMEPDAQALLEGYYGAQRFTNIRHLLTKAPGHTCLRVNRLQVKDVGAALAEVQEALKGYFDKIGAALGGSESVPQPHLFPHAPLSEDTILVPSVRLPVEPLPEGFPREEDKVVVVGRLCGEAVLRGADVFAAGVISASAGITPGTPVIILTDLDMASHRCNRGTDFRDYRGPAGFIGRGIARYGRGVMFREKHGLAIEVTARLGWQAPPLNNLMPGRIYAQNLPSVVVGHLLCPTPGSSVIDLCAGPGGKTSHLASLMQNKGLLVACDRSRKKVLEIRRLCEESGATCVVPLVLDSSHAVTPKEQQHERHLPSSQPAALIEAAALDKHGLRDLKAFYPETFDYVLLDPPCSALGLRPRFALDATAKALHGSADFQRNFLWTAVFLLKPGGTLVYSTCTISPLENECMVRYALDTYPCLRLVAASPKIGGEGVETAGLSNEERSLVQSFDPANEELDTTGFFAAKFVKTASLFEGKEDGAEGGAGGQTAEA